MNLRPRAAETTPVSRAFPGPLDPETLQVCDDMTIEVALSVMDCARTGHLLICDHDGLCAALVTREQLTAARTTSGYTDRSRLRELLDAREPFTSPPAG
ncbi:CBS domain-containing protein [Streptomyces rubiginosohelvolus]